MGGSSARIRDLLASALGVAIAVGLLALVSERAGGWRAARTALAAVPALALLPALLCEGAVQCCRAWKWSALLRAVPGAPPVRFGSVLRGIVVGAASTHLVPLRMDELLRAAVLSRRERIPAATVLGTVAVDRLVDVGVAGLLLLAVAAAGVELPPWMRLGALGLWGAFALGLLVLVALLRSGRQVEERLAASAVPLLPQLATPLASLRRGLSGLPRGGRPLLGVIGGAAGEWAATMALYAWMLGLLAGASSPGPGVPLMLSLGNAVAYAVPNVPGALGTYEAVQVSVLEHAAGMERAPALALALLCHAILMVPVTLLGVVLGVREWRRPRAEALPA
jgi:hypothetical protein